MFLRLLKYPGLTVVYTPGKDMLVADCLSRAPLHEIEEFDAQLEGVVHSLVKRACMSADNFKLYGETLNHDERYMRIVRYVVEGWPSYHKLDDLSQMFYKHRHELHYENGLLFKDHRLVIPTKLQNLICKWLHAPHLGIEKTLARARMQFFWPGMTNDISELVKACVTCEKFLRNNPKEPLKQDDPPEYPFQKVSTDIYEYGGKDWLVVVDSYSGFICSERLQDKSMQSVCQLFERFFNAYGYPTQIRSDNIPFNSMIGENYANKTNIRFVFSSPRYPQSNGLAEKAVAIAKNILKRCYELGEVDQFQYRLLEYNTTPVAGMKLTPSQLFFGRQLKTRLPVDESLLTRECIAESTVRDKIEKKLAVQKKNYDKTARPLIPINVGDRVTFKKCSKEWQYGTITRDVNGRSYIVRDGFGNYFRRNRRFLKHTTNDIIDPRDIIVEHHLKGYSQNHEQPQMDVIDKTLPCSQSRSPTLVPDYESNPTAFVSVPVSPVAISESSLVPNSTTDSSLISNSTADSSHKFQSVSDPYLSKPLPSSHNGLLNESQAKHITSRSGRSIKPPKRYGQWLY